MNGRVMLVAAITIIAVVSISSVVITAPEALASRRTTRRFLNSSVVPAGSNAEHGHRPIVDRILPARVLLPVRDILDRGRRRRADIRIPDALDRVVRNLRSGSTLALALRHVGDDDPVFARLAAELRAGNSLQSAVREWGAEDELPNRRLTATALDLASTAGGASARVLDGVASSLRDRVALEREVAALSSQSRASAVVLVVAPLAFAAAAAMFDPRLLDMLVGTPIGWACMGLGLGLDALGAVWMSRLISRHR